MSETFVAVAVPGAGSGGSVAAVAIHHAEELAKSFRVTLVSESEPASGRGFDLRLVPARDFRALRRFAHVPRELSFALSVRRALEKLDAVHPLHAAVYHGHVLAAVTGARLARRNGIPAVLVTHGDVYERPPGTYDTRLTALYKAVTPVAYRECEATIALSRAMARQVQLGGADPSSVHVVPNGVEPAEIGLGPALDPENPPKPARPLHILYVGRLAIEKGVADLLEALELLRPEKRGMSLQIVGRGPEESSLRRAAERLDSGTVSFHGAIPRIDLGNWYAGADVVCVPSISDPFPGVVLEALAAGTPVLGTTAGGIPDVVVPGVNGLLVPPARPSQIAAALRQLDDDRSELRRLSSAARGSVWPKYSWPERGIPLRQLVAEIVEKQHTGTSRWADT